MAEAVKTKHRSSSRYSKPSRVNVRLLMFLLGGCVVTAGATHGLHAFQLDRNSNALSLRAEELTRDGKDQEAIRDYQQYLSLRPRDTDSRIRMGQLLDQNAETPRQRLLVYKVFERVLRDDPTRDGIRSRQVEIKMSFRRFDEAVEDLKLLLKSSPGDGELEFKIGQCEEYGGRPQEAIVWYRRAVDHEHHSPEVFLQMVRLLHRPLQQPREAEQLIETMIKVNSQSAVAFRARTRYRRTFGSLEQALADAREAARLAPDDAEALQLMATLIVSDPNSSSADLNKLQNTLQSRLVNGNDDTPIHRLLSELHLRLGKTRWHP